MRQHRIEARRGGARRAAAVFVCALLAYLLLTPATPAHADWAPVTPLPGLGDGRIWSVAVSPADPTLLLAGTDSGVYLSHDTGKSWKNVASSGTRVWVVGIDPNHPSDLYAGTDGGGIQRSADSGATWTHISAGLPSQDIRALTFSLSQIAVGTDNGVAVSADGVSWRAGGMQGTSISAIAVVSNAPSLVLIAGTDSGSVSRGFLFMNNGSTWSVVKGNGLPNGAVALSLTSGGITASIPHRPIVVDTSQGSFRSLDSGQTWTASQGLPQVGTQTITLTTATFDPLDPDVVFSGADAAGSTGGQMMTSVDSGLTYTDFSSGLPTNQRNVVSIAVAQVTPPVVYVAIDPPGTGARIFSITDTGAPAPPALVAEAPGAPIPAAVATPTPSATAKPTPKGAVAAAQQASFLGTVFHWPMPLVVELLIILVGGYAYYQWRQRRYVQGPPDAS